CSRAACFDQISLCSSFSLPHVAQTSVCALSCHLKSHRLKSVLLVEPAMRFELMTSSLPRRRSTPELRGRCRASCQLASWSIQIKCQQVNNLFHSSGRCRASCQLASWSIQSKWQQVNNLFHSTGAGDETRTRDPQLGRLMLYQLSYTRP